MDRTNKMMLFIMPLMYLWFGYIMPAGMCVYMAFNAIFMAVQELICARMLRGKYAEMEAARQKRLEEEKEKERQRKAEIAARRAAEEEERKKNRGKKKTDKSKKTPAPKESRVGMRTYARGRAYDPNRYTVTPYHDPSGKVAEEPLAEPTPEERPETLAEPVAPEQDVTTAVETTEVPMAENDPAEETSPETVEAPAEPAAEPEVEKTPNADQLFEAIQQDAKGEDKE